MIYVVEIEGPGGERATKEYSATCLRDALQQAAGDLRDYPHCEITDIVARDVGIEEWDWAA